MAPSSINSPVGEYKLVDFLGAGGMGEVYRAVHSKLGRVVAVKVLTHPSHDTDFFRRFLNEARIQASLQHQNIATLYDFIEKDGHPCIVMEYVDGETLLDLIGKYGYIQPAEAVRIMKSVVEAIGYIHGNRVIHRDIKSNNVKINSRGQVKLLDFGIAQGQFTPRMTATGNVIGTVQYLSPEQIKGAPADPRSDIWALGVLFYEMVAGRVPFEGTNTLTLYEKISKVSFLPPRQVNPEVPHPIEAIILRCLRKSPADRYGSADALLSDLQKLEQPVRSAPGAPRLPIPRVPRWMRNNLPFLAALGAAAVLIVLLMLWVLQPGPPAANGSGQDQGKITGAVTTAERQTVLIDVMEGKAEVYRNNEPLGQTPYRLETSLGEHVEIILKRPGFADKKLEFSTTAGTTGFTVPMQRIK